MAGFIRELYFGNIEAQARPVHHSAAFEKISQELDELEEQLTAALGGDSKHQFLRFANLVQEYIGTALAESFEVGFRLGGLCVYDVFAGDTIPAVPYVTEEIEK